MIKYCIFIIFGIILYLLLNLHEKFEAVGECNCRDSNNQPIYDRENCLNVFDMDEFGNVIPRLDSNGLPCVYKDHFTAKLLFNLNPFTATDGIVHMPFAGCLARDQPAHPRSPT